jgi:hypothetical protein
MTEDYSIIFQKEKPGSPRKDLVSDFGMVCISFPFQSGFETKEVTTEDWIEEDGEDSFEPDILPLKAYDLEAEIGYQGSNFKAKLKSFLDYLIGLDGNGVKLKVYNPHSKIGRKGLRFIKYEPVFSSSDVFTFKVTFRVTDPRTEISLVKRNNIITLE